MKKLLFVLLMVTMITGVAMAKKGAVTTKQVYVTEQTDVVLAEPGNGESLVIWNIVVKTEGSVVVKFAGGTIIAEVINGDTGISNIGLEGAVDEDVLISCPANTEVILFADSIK